MLSLIISMLIVGTLAQNTGDNNKFALLDLKSQVQVVMDAAKYYLNEGAPSITKLFVVENPNEIIRLEGELKKKILQDLLDQLVEVWAEMNMRVLKGYRVLKSLRDKADSLVKELKRNGLVNIIDSEGVKRRIADRVNKLLDNAKEVFCVQGGNLTGLALTEKQLLNLTTRLHYDHVKIHLLKMVYSYRLNNLMNITSDIDEKEYETLKEVWVMVNAWGKWSVLDLMAFIKEPLSDLHSDVQEYVDDLLSKMQEIIDETLENILEVVIAKGGYNYNTDLVKLFTIVSEADDPLYILCKQ